MAKDKMKRMKDTINASRIPDKQSKKVIIENAQAALKGKNKDTLTSSSEQSSTKLNPFLFLVVFPIVSTATLAFFNDEMREDFYKKIGFKSNDVDNRQQNSTHVSD